MWNFEKKKKKLTFTLDTTLTLFKNGKTIDEICSIRSFKLQTVEYQIIELITMGFINVEDIVSREKIEKISNLILVENVLSLSLIKDKLKEEFSYFEIKCVIASLNLIPHRL